MSLLKVIERIGCVRSQFRVTFAPISVKVQTNEASEFKLQVKSGSNAPLRTRAV